MIVPITSPTSDKEKLSLLAKAFFIAATKMSKDEDDILPQANRDRDAGFALHFRGHDITPFTLIVFSALQEDGEDAKLSVFRLFSELFPEVANMKGRHGNMRRQYGAHFSLPPLHIGLI
jgi:hypothetical protein